MSNEELKETYIIENDPTLVEWGGKKLGTLVDKVTRVYNNTIDTLGKNLGAVSRSDKRAMNHALREVEVDAWFAKHHITYLKRVISREVEKFDKAVQRYDAAVESGDEKRVRRAAQHAEKVRDAGIRRISEAFRLVAKHLLKDTKAAAKHIVKALEKLDDNGLVFEEDLQKAEEKAADKLRKIVEEEEKELSN